MSKVVHGVTATTKSYECVDGGVAAYSVGSPC
jgi:hypothetical protein